MTVSFVGVGDINKTYHFKTAARMFFLINLFNYRSFLDHLIELKNYQKYRENAPKAEGTLQLF